jgi:rod shape determining protein RodA
MNPYNFIFEKLLSLNKPLIYLILAIFIFGIFMLYSASGGSFDPWASKQLLYFIAFFPIMLLIALIDIKLWFKLAYFIYLAGLGLLIIVETRGYTAMGATRWLRIGGVNIQPSEIMKVCLIVGFAKYFHNREEQQIKQNKYLIIPLLMMILPFVLIIKQPDLGTALIMVIIGITILFAVGVQVWKFAAIGIVGLTALPFVWKYFLHVYQRQRILIFFNPEADPLGSGYNIIQSKIAIGSGGFLGKGLLRGTQGQLAFLPEKQTDFIFTMLSEELGFVGGAIVIALYLLLICYTLAVGIRCRHTYGRIIAVGIASMIFFHVFINIAMVMGVLPVVGAPLPLLSYGGTISMVTLVGFGFLLNADLYKNIEIK